MILLRVEPGIWNLITADGPGWWLLIFDYEVHVTFEFCIALM